MLPLCSETKESKNQTHLYSANDEQTCKIRPFPPHFYKEETNIWEGFQ